MGARRRQEVAEPALELASAKVQGVMLGSAGEPHAALGLVMEQSGGLPWRWAGAPPMKRIGCTRKSSCRELLSADPVEGKEQRSFQGLVINSYGTGYREKLAYS